MSRTTYNKDGTVASGSGGGITQLTGNVTAGPGGGSQAATIPANTVTEAMQNLSDVTTGNVSTTAHGYAPKGTNTGTKFLDDTGNYSTPAGSGNVTGSSLTANELIIGSGGSAIATLGAAGTNHQVLHGNASGAPTFSAVALSTDVSGTLPVANGGTGATSYTNGQLLIGDSGSGGLDVATLTAGSDISITNAAGSITIATTTANHTRAIQATVNGSGSVPSTGVFADCWVPYACTITAVNMQADQSGSAVIDIWAGTSSTSAPTVANTITASDLPTLSSAIGSRDTTLTSWTTAIAAGTWLRFNLNSVTTCTRVAVTLTVTT